MIVGIAEEDTAEEIVTKYKIIACEKQGKKISIFILSTKADDSHWLA